MEQESDFPKKRLESKGAPLFKKILEDRKLIRETLRNGGSLEDLKDKINFVKPFSFK